MQRHSCYIELKYIFITMNLFLNRYFVYTANTYSKKYKIFLIIFPDTIVNPWTMVVHFSNASTNKQYYLYYLPFSRFRLRKIYLWQTEQ